MVLVCSLHITWLTCIMYIRECILMEVLCKRCMCMCRAPDYEARQEWRGMVRLGFQHWVLPCPRDTNLQEGWWQLSHRSHLCCHLSRIPRFPCISIYHKAHNKVDRDIYTVPLALLWSVVQAWQYIHIWHYKCTYIYCIPFTASFIAHHISSLLLGHTSAWFCAIPHSPHCIKVHKLHSLVSH